MKKWLKASVTAGALAAIMALSVTSLSALAYNRPWTKEESVYEPYFKDRGFPPSNAYYNFQKQADGRYAVYLQGRLLKMEDLEEAQKYRETDDGGRLSLSVGCDDSGMERDYYVDVDGYLKSGWRRMPGMVNPAYADQRKLDVYKEKYSHFITDYGDSNESGTFCYNEWAYYSPIDYCAVEGWTEIDGKKYFFGTGGHPFTRDGVHMLKYGNPTDGIMLYDTYTPDGYYVGPDGTLDESVPQVRGQWVNVITNHITNNLELFEQCDMTSELMPAVYKEDGVTLVQRFGFRTYWVP